MKKIVTFSVFIILIISCRKNNEIPFDLVEIDAKTIELSAQNTEFGFDIFKKLNEVDPDSNIFISPLSISTALAMTLNGAAGETRTEMQNVMRFNDWDIETINASFKDLLISLPTLDEDVKVKLANSIWYAPGVTVYQDFIDANVDYYNSEVNETEISDEALAIINNWCSDKTDGLIEDVINQFPPNFVMFLINAIYFQGAWTQEFDAENTYEGSFFLENGDYTEVDMMNYGGLIELPYFETADFQAVDLEYGNGIFSMFILLPKNGVSVNDIIQNMNSENWDTWINSFENDSIYLQMPKFKIAYDKKLGDILQDLGMVKAFASELGSFSNMTNIPDVHIGEVFHKSFIEVNEEGTEAAAVTVVEMVYESTSLDPQFFANKPFLFFIRDNKTNSVLFEGVLKNPS